MPAEVTLRDLELHRENSPLPGYYRLHQGDDYGSRDLVGQIGYPGKLPQVLELHVPLGEALGRLGQVGLARTRELLKRRKSYATKITPDRPPAAVFGGDARELRDIHDDSVDLIVSSPPYPGVYDYLTHHSTRLNWLGLDGTKFARTEMGSRRQMAKLREEDAIDIWESDLGRCLEQIHRVLRVGGRACLIMADSAIQSRAIFADSTLSKLATEVGLQNVARASQVRPHFHRDSERAFGDEPRREHVLVLQK